MEDFMKHLLTVTALFVLSLGIAARAQGTTVPVPTATTYTANLAWPLPAGCSACTFQVYCVPGTVTITPGTVATLVATTAAGATTAIDASLAPGQTLSCAVVSVLAGFPDSVPSNTVTVTIPNALADVVITITVVP